MVTISAKIPHNVYEELLLRVPERERSQFIREAVIEKLIKMPKPDRLRELEERITKLEDSLSKLKHTLADLELLTYKRGEIDVYEFCEDRVDRTIIDFLLKNKGATTSELARLLGVNRWRVLGRLMRIKEKSEAELGKPIVEFDPGLREGKRRAWWLTVE